ncbi:MAG: hypothetical protein K6D37_07960 [Prevotella sp.]|nr:hypothetical protein [Prevotella sp.]
MSDNRKRKPMVTGTSMRSAMHFLVDGICVCCLYLVAERCRVGVLLWAFMTYNVMAFLTQPLTGHLADRTKDSRWMPLAAVGLLCMGAAVVAVATALGVVAAWMSPLVFLAAATLGAGNSLFHVWGGKATAVATGNDIRQLGVFVATGALGLAVGVAFASWLLLAAFIIGLAMLTVSVATGAAGATGTAGATVALSLSPVWVVGAMLVVIVVVMLRSLIGQTFAGGDLKSLTLLVGLTAMLGKMAGGWMSHYMGLVPASAVMVLAVAICLLWPGSSVVMMVAGLFAVNCTMPVTLYLANVLMPGREGLAFGLLAAALMPGYLLATMNHAL